MSEHKAPKTITEEDEACMTDDAHQHIDWMTEEYPEARPIDVVNAYLRAFSERVSEGRHSG